MLKRVGIAGAIVEDVDDAFDQGVLFQLGDVKELARLDHSFERGLTDVSASYRLRGGGGIEVVNEGFDGESGEWRSVTGKAFFAGESDVGELKVSFFGPFYGGYNVIDLDREHYCWSVVAGPTRSFLWILSRTPELDPATLERLTKRVADLGFPSERLIRVEQNRSRLPIGARDRGACE